MGLELLAAAVVVALVAGLIWDRRYRGRDAGGRAEPTGEVFRDPVSGRLTRVYQDPITGRRDYQEEPDGR